MGFRTIFPFANHFKHSSSNVLWLAVDKDDNGNLKLERVNIKSRTVLFYIDKVTYYTKDKNRTSMHIHVSMSLLCRPSCRWCTDQLHILHTHLHFSQPTRSAFTKHLNTRRWTNVGTMLAQGQDSTGPANTVLEDLITGMWTTRLVGHRGDILSDRLSSYI